MRQICGRKIALSVKGYQANKQLTQAGRTDVHQRYTIKTLQDTIRSTLNTLAARCDLQDENKKLKEVIKSMQQKEQQREKEHAEQCAALQRQTQQLNDQHTTNLANQQRMFNAKLAEAEMRHAKQLEHKDTEMTSLKSQSDDAERQHHVQLTRLQMDYDEKMKKLQRQLSAAQVPASKQLATNQEIFRKKVQHMKAEHQQEIDKLQHTIVDLQRQLQQHQDQPPHQSANQRQQASNSGAAHHTGTSTLSYKRPVRYC